MQNTALFAIFGFVQTHLCLHCNKKNEKATMRILIQDFLHHAVLNIKV